MKRLKLSAFIFSVNIVTLITSSAAYGQGSDEENVPPAREGRLSADDGAAVPEAPATEDRSYETPLDDDRDEASEVQTNGTAPNEAGPQVDDAYNMVDESSNSLWSLLRVGPTVQVGFPHPITYGLEGIFAKVFSFGFSTGSYEVTQVDKANIEIKSWDLFARWHPLAGSFFLGGAFGHQDIDGRFEDDIDLTLNGFPQTVPVRVDVSIKSDYFSPRLGWLAVYDSGFTLGFEIGAQFPLSPETSVNASVPGASAFEEAQVKQTSDYKDVKKQADDAVKILGKRTLPFVSLLKMGWLF